MAEFNRLHTIRVSSRGTAISPYAAALIDWAESVQGYDKDHDGYDNDYETMLLNDGTRIER